VVIAHERREKAASREGPKVEEVNSVRGERREAGGLVLGGTKRA